MSGLVFEVKAGTGLPVGTYPCEFDRAEEFQDDANQYGPGVKLVWKVTGGDHEGEEATRICSQKLSPKSNLFKFVKQLLGREPQPGEQVALASFAGTVGTCVIEELDSGSTRVSAFIRSA